MYYYLITEVNRNTGDRHNVGLVINIQDAASFIQAVSPNCGEMTTRMTKNLKNGVETTEFRFEHSQCQYYVAEPVKVINNVMDSKVYY